MLQKHRNTHILGTHVHINIQKSGCATLLRMLRIRFGFFSTYHKIAAADRILLKIIDK